VASWAAAPPNARRSGREEIRAAADTPCGSIYAMWVTESGFGEARPPLPAYPTWKQWA